MLRARAELLMWLLVELDGFQSRLVCSSPTLGDDSMASKVLLQHQALVTSGFMYGANDLAPPAKTCERAGRHVVFLKHPVVSVSSALPPFLLRQCRQEITPGAVLA